MGFYRIAKRLLLTERNSYVTGVFFLVIDTFLALIVPDGVLTHNNNLFGNGLYNMETHISVIETKPCTYPAEFGLLPADRLICVKVWQRSLHMPRAFFVILTHETAHYVGDEIRKREERLKQDDYEVAFNISEGYRTDDPIISQKDFNRRRVVEKVYYNDKREGGVLRETGKDLSKYWPCLEAVPNNMIKYLESCKEALSMQVTGKFSDVKEIRKIVEMFCNKGYTFRQVYKFMDEKAQEYAEEVKVTLQKDLA